MAVRRLGRTRGQVSGIPQSHGDTNQVQVPMSVRQVPKSARESTSAVRETAHNRQANVNTVSALTQPFLQECFCRWDQCTLEPVRAREVVRCNGVDDSGPCCTLCHLEALLVQR